MKARIKYVAILIVFTSLVSCQSSNQKAYLETFHENGNWGYEIKVNNKVYIHQDCIPAMAGNKHFASKKEAELVGKLVLRKIMNKETPAVNTGELRQLGIKGTS
ncbi:DUF4907 domain-containing protein [Saccharicrinis sp. 156]|uniref:DUF4907 domain-containing protein n=1 Tax=Saccharicrinis sp. 156 TaxID=3417574 RepID=UPI003D32B6AE